MARRKKPIDGGQFWSLTKQMRDCPAYQSLNPTERAVLEELRCSYNGKNNGEIFLSCRHAAKRLHISKDSVQRAFKVLIARGFIRERAREAMHYEERMARCWILTEHDFVTMPATMSFMKWRPDEKTE